MEPSDLLKKNVLDRICTHPSFQSLIVRADLAILQENTKNKLDSYPTEPSDQSVSQVNPMSERVKIFSGSNPYTKIIRPLMLWTSFICHWLRTSIHLYNPSLMMISLTITPPKAVIFRNTLFEASDVMHMDVTIALKILWASIIHRYTSRDLWNLELVK